MLDHTLLKPEATRDQVLALCREAAEHRFACAMVNPAWVPLATSALAGTGLPVGVVIGFPLGANLSTTKRDEAREMVKMGARELDMVLNIGMLKSGLYEQAEADIRTVVEVGRAAGAVVKVILETCLLTMPEKLRAAEMAIHAGADYLKTSTGFSTGGATAADVALLRGIAGRQMRRQGLRRYPHAERGACHAGGRRNPHRRKRGCTHSPGAECCARSGRANRTHLNN